MAVTEPQAVMPQAVITDELAFVAGAGTPIPRLKAHAAALHDYHAHPAWAFRDPVTIRTEAVNQRGDVVIPGHAVIALPSRDAGPSPSARKAKTS